MMMNIGSLKLFILLLFLLKKAEANDDEICKSETCSSCIRNQLCGWCTDVIINGSRCVPLKSNTCENLENPENKFIFEKNDSLSKGEHTVQIQPQKLQIKMRPNTKHKISVKYAQAEDYPVDLYFLMDLSSSMKDDKEKLASLGQRLAQDMKKITSNFRLGFGSFVDKTVMPFTSTLEKNLRSPCTDCAPAYDYRHHMNLSSNATEFQKLVREAKISGNLDGPEGTLDGIMQAMVCKDRIGWRDQSRRLLLVSTDASFHIAGDGKLGGIIDRNDGLCHLDKDGFYTHGNLQDYPSIPHINMEAIRNSINIIFAVTRVQKELYDILSKRIQGAGFGVLADDSSNIVQLIQDQYNLIRSSVELKDDAHHSAINIKYFSSCLSKRERKATSKCENLPVGREVTFDVELELLACPKNPKDWKKTINITPVGINEKLSIDLEMLCGCPCESEDKIEKDSEICSGNGNLMCGECKCKDSHSGTTCSCDRTGDFTNSTLCRTDNTTEKICNGRGSCECGKCVCEKRNDPSEEYSGPFCEFDNFMCDRPNGQLCSGNGECIRGKCQCKSPWTKEGCQCYNETDTCIAPGSSLICSGHGSCECGSCECERSHFGKYCENCPSCPGRCPEMKNCVLCKIFQTGVLKNAKDCSANCTNFDIQSVDTLEYTKTRQEKQCEFFDENNCRFQFIYSETGDNQVSVRALKTKECSQEIPIIPLVIGLVTAVVVIGILTLIFWKCVTTIHDRKEYAKFQNDLAQIDFAANDNPLYRKTRQSYQNPMFGK